MSDMVIITKNEYDMLKLRAMDDAITIGRGEYDRLKERSNMLNLVRRILTNKEYCEDELRMLLEIKEMEVANG